jgi:hypothetical protein
MTSEFEMSEQLQSRPTRRVVVATGAKLAYTVPIVAASLKVSGVNAQAISPIKDNCFHSSGTNGGCMPTCTDLAGFTGAQCGVICGTGTSTGACSVGQGEGNECCNPGYCDPANYRADANGDPEYTGPPTGGCTAAASVKKQGKAKRR